MRFVILALSILVACGGDVADPASDAGALARSGGESGDVAKLTGGGRVHYEDVGGYDSADESYGITARERADGSVDGSIEMHWPAPYDVKAHGDVTCLNVDGDEAWMGFVVTRTDNDDGYPVGSAWVVWLADNGSGKGADPDQIGYFYAVSSASICDALSGPIGDVFDWADGNITIH